jgi:hypothetical protein
VGWGPKVKKIETGDQNFKKEIFYPSQNISKNKSTKVNVFGPNL